MKQRQCLYNNNNTFKLYPGRKAIQCREEFVLIKYYFFAEETMVITQNQKRGLLPLVYDEFLNLGERVEGQKKGGVVKTRDQ